MHLTPTCIMGTYDVAKVVQYIVVISEDELLSD